MITIGCFFLYPFFHPISEFLREKLLKDIQLGPDQLKLTERHVI